MNNYIALQSFDDCRLGSVRRNQTIPLNDFFAREYVSAGLLRLVHESPPLESLTVFCIASGPSLTAEQVAAVKELRDSRGSDQVKVIAINTSFRMCPWADVLFAMDKVWWDQYGAEAKKFFSGQMLTYSKQARGIEKAAIQHCNNSGAGAICVAVKMNPARIILLGYDCRHVGGKKHWHGDHPKHLGNAGNVNLWPAQFETLAQQFFKQRIINCSPLTALRCFEKMSLESALNECN